MKEEGLYELIDLYIKGELPEDHPFQKKVLVEEELQKEIEIHRLLKDAIVDHELLRLKQELRNHHELQKTSGRSSSKKWLYGTVIIMVLLLGFFAYKKIAKEPMKEGNKRLILETVPLEKSKSLNEEEKNPQYLNNREGLPKKVISGSNKKIQVQDTILHGQPKSLWENHDPLPEIKENAPAAQQRTTPEPGSDLLEGDNVICAQVTFTAKVLQESPCEGKDNGTIKIEHVVGGVSPYEYAINNTLDFQSASVFKHLEAGKYKIVLKDKNGCTGMVDSSFMLHSKKCLDFIKLSFNPQIGLLEIPRDIKENGKLQIYNKSGQVVVYKEVSTSEIIYWNGTMDGVLLPPGLYMFSIAYSSGKMEQGSITIIY